MIEIAFELGINLIETFLIIDFITRYLGCKYSGSKKILGFLGGWLVAFAELSIANYISKYEGFASFIPVIIYFVYALLCLKGSVQLKLWISVIAQLIIMAIALVVNLLVCNVIGYDPSAMIYVFNSVRVISIIITKILLFYITRILLRNRHKNPMDSYTWFMLTLVPSISLVSMTALMFAVLNHEEIKAHILLGMGCIVTANIITYYLFAALNKEYKTKLKISLLEQENENAKKSIENADAFVKQMKSVKHDVKNQLVIIYNHIDSGDYEEAKAYIKNLTGNYLPDIQNFMNTGNRAFDAIMNSKIAICNQKNIKIEAKVMNGSLNKFDAVDIGVVFGNLIDNAIESAEKTQKRRITVDVQIQGAYLSVLVTNSIEESVLENNPLLKTSKNDKEMHGIGTKTVEELVKKYNGMVQYFEEEQEFCCHILLSVSE